MRIGDLKKRIILQYQTRVPDGMGGFTISWVDHATVYASIWPVSASEIVSANSLTMVISHRIRIRYRSVLKPSWRVKFGNRFFSIVSILNLSENNRILDLMCKEANE